MLKKIIFGFQVVGAVIAGLFALLGVRALTLFIKQDSGLYGIFLETLLLLVLIVGAIALVVNQYLKQYEEKK